MTIDDIISKVDTLCPNQYSSETKLEWLNELDGRIWNELISTHENPIREAFTKYTTATEELLCPYPYGGDIYCYYLQGKIAAQNAETVKYNQYMTLYNTEYQNLCNLYCRTHKHLPPAGGNRLHF